MPLWETGLYNKQFQADLIKLSFPYFIDIWSCSSLSIIIDILFYLLSVTRIAAQNIVPSPYCFLLTYKLNSFGSNSLLVVVTDNGCYYSCPH